MTNDEFKILTVAFFSINVSLHILCVLYEGGVIQIGVVSEAFLSITFYSILNLQSKKNTSRKPF